MLQKNANKTITSTVTLTSTLYKDLVAKKNKEESEKVHQIGNAIKLIQLLKNILLICLRKAKGTNKGKKLKGKAKSLPRTTKKSS